MVATYFTRGLGQQIINRRAGTNAPSYYHYDALGSVTALTGTDVSTASDTYYYTAFGMVRPKADGTTPTNPTTNPFRYLGNKTAAAGLYDFHARAYEPATGRFLQEDPVEGIVGLPQSLNPYAYGYNNPYATPDPNGDVVFLIPVAIYIGVTVGGEMAINTAGNAVDYYLTAEEKRSGGLVGVLGESAGSTVAALRSPWTWAPWHKLDTARDALRIADDVVDAVPSSKLNPCATPNSFDGDEKVLMADGSEKRISKVEEGDRVVATDPETGKESVREVTDVIRGEGNKEMVDIEVDGDVLSATDEHPFYVVKAPFRGGEWVDADDLRIGDTLVDPDGRLVTVDDLRRYEKSDVVYNLTVEGVHTYYVEVSDEWVLVHNQNTTRHGVTRKNAADWKFTKDI